ncbi:hypothetical protein C8J57DRAFT_1525074 [Mycena rebaudengoi]|nr:hypothetical protein C8J57DRAFT_1525074 [Mycena rebaudengoi]
MTFFHLVPGPLDTLLCYSPAIVLDANQFLNNGNGNGSESEPPSQASCAMPTTLAPPYRCRTTAPQKAPRPSRPAASRSSPPTSAPSSPLPPMPSIHPLIFNPPPLSPCPSESFITSRPLSPCSPALFSSLLVPAAYPLPFPLLSSRSLVYASVLRIPPVLALRCRLRTVSTPGRCVGMIRGGVTLCRACESVPSRVRAIFPLSRGGASSPWHAAPAFRAVCVLAAQMPSFLTDGVSPRTWGRSHQSHHGSLCSSPRLGSHNVLSENT